MNTCITIRTIVLNGNDAYIQAGAGIVADSVPEREYEETLNKAKGLLKAIELAEKLRVATINKMSIARILQIIGIILVLEALYFGIARDSMKTEVVFYLLAA